MDNVRNINNCVNIPCRRGGPEIRPLHRDLQWYIVLLIYHSHELSNFIFAPESGYFIANLPFLIVHIYIFSPRSFSQESAEDIWHEHEDAVCYSDDGDDDEDDDVLVLDTDEHLIKEMDELLSDLKL
jgi:hypothetical protein